MRVYENSLSIHDAYAPGTELGELIGLRIKELAEYEEKDFSSLIKILVLEPSDVLTKVDAELGFSLITRQCDAAESHQEWFELTWVISDDGYGVVVYVPKKYNLNSQLIDYCANQVRAFLP